MLTRAQIEEVKRTFEEQTKGFTREDVWWFMVLTLPYIILVMFT
jgi:hypothetical protein